MLQSFHAAAAAGTAAEAVPAGSATKEQKRQQLLTQLAALDQPVSPELQSSCIIESDSVVPIVRMLRMVRC